MRSARARAAHPDVTIEQFGEASANKWFNDTIMKDFKRAEWTAVPLALGILLVVFGALVAASLPVLLALTAFFAANGLLALISHAMHVDSSASSVMLLMGLAVGVDYCLFYLRREREERAAGRDQQTALRVAAATSGRSVLISGLTVMVAMAGMFLSGMQLFAGFAVATISVVFIAMVGSVTVLPALMSLLGDKVEFGHIPYFGRASRPTGGSRVWKMVLDRVLARPGISAALASGLLLLLAAPRDRPAYRDTQRRADTPVQHAHRAELRAHHDGVPGRPRPGSGRVQGARHRCAPGTARHHRLPQAAGRSGEIGQPIEVTVHRGANLAEIQVPLAGTGTDATSRHALTTLHDTLVPTTLGKVPGGQALVAENLAASIDFNNQLRHGIVPVFLFVMGITFIVMLVAFGSITIATTTIGLNLLSVGAAYGVMVAVFQHGWGAALIGTTAPGAIESWIPLFVFVVLFGLSMDYNVFVVSRIKEAHDHGMRTPQAVAHGIRATAGVVTSAAVIMVAVFAVFGTLSLQQFKQLSVGLAVAVLLDATVVRGVLLPSVMVLLGERNWYLPRWLSWLPKPAARPARSVPAAFRPSPLPPGLSHPPDGDPAHHGTRQGATPAVGSQCMQSVEHLLEQVLVGHPSSRCHGPHLDQALLDEIVEQNAYHAQREPDGRGQVGYGDGVTAQVQDPTALGAEGEGFSRAAAAGNDVDQVEVPLTSRPCPAAGDGVGPGHRAGVPVHPSIVV